MQNFGVIRMTLFSAYSKIKLQAMRCGANAQLERAGCSQNKKPPKPVCPRSQTAAVATPMLSRSEFLLPEQPIPIDLVVILIFLQILLSTELLVHNHVATEA